MIDPTTSLKETRNSNTEETANVRAHKKKLAPISLASAPQDKMHKLTNSGSLIQDDMIITKDGIRINNPRTHSDLTNDPNLLNQMNNLSISDGMDISRSRDMSIQSDQGMSIQSEYNPNNDSKMSIQSMNSDLNKSKTKTSYGDQGDFKVPNSKPGDKNGAGSGAKSIVQDFFDDDKSGDSALHSNIRFEDLKKLTMLGQGSQGSVAKMLHVPSNTIIALKSLQFNTDETFHKQLKLELATLRSCNCDHIVKCFGAFYQQGVISIALEYMDIGSLADVLKAIGQIPEVILGAITYQVLKGLEYLHKATKVIHRDIKPSNLLINSEGEVKIADFGVSGKIESTLEYKSSWVGTVTYMSPERFGGEKYNHDTDLWSLGLTIVECALGRFPYPEPGSNVKTLSFFDLMEYISSKPAPTLPEGFSNDIKDFVAICLSKQGGTRSSATELLKHPFVKKYAKISTKSFKEWLKHLPR